MLRILIIMLWNFYAMAEAHHMQDLNRETSNIIINNLAKKLSTSSGAIEDNIENILTPKILLKIFVSSSMPENALQIYATEAKKYGATLIIKGLPENSFLALSKLVQKISIKSEIAMQIDEEAFTKFNITEVPSIVLVKEEACFTVQNCQFKYDKITGQVRLAYALEQFSESGDLSQDASALIK